jgi:hypothetical protein
MSDLSHLRCHDCAFTAGTDASKSDITRMQARLCAESNEPFYCHVNEPSLCAGYIEAAIKLREKGFHANEPEWRQEVRKALLETIGYAAEGLIHDDEFPQVFRRTLERSVHEISAASTLS